MNKAKKSISELNIIIQELYESFALNKIPKNQYCCQKKAMLSCSMLQSLKFPMKSVKQLALMV